MKKLTRSVEKYEEANGWSSKLFAKPATSFMKELQERGVKVDVGRTVIYVGDKLKCYVHHNGRSREYATVTDMSGAELITVHYTEFEKLKDFINSQV